MSRFSSVQYGGRVYAKIKKIVIVIIMCSKLMFLQRFKYTDHYYIANIWCSRRSARFVSCMWFLKIKSESESEEEKSPSGAKLMPCAFLCIGRSNTVLLAVVMHFLYHSTATLLRRCCFN